jgi:hypothetical protein
MSLEGFIADVQRLRELGEAFRELNRRRARQASGEIELVEVRPGVWATPRQRSPMQRLPADHPFRELAGVLWPPR